jgi:protein-S-isoprenylcysteine O-methyltransferase Ste14
MNQIRSLGLRDALSGAEQVGILLAALSVLAVAAAVVVNFAMDRQSGHSSSGEFKRNSFVSTLSMTLFFVACWLVLLLHLGELSPPKAWRGPLALSGGIIMAIGAAVNVAGRLSLGRQWSDPVRVHADHHLVTKGPFSYVRHPLYASLVWMLVGAALIYANWLLLAADLLVFLPFMNLRAGQEETALKERLAGYDVYCARTGRFLPRLRRRPS